MKKLVSTDPIPAIESSLEIFGSDALYNTAEEQRDEMASSAAQVPTTNQIMVVALRGHINDSVFDFEECRKLLEPPKVNEQTTDFLFSGW